MGGHCRAHSRARRVILSSMLMLLAGSAVCGSAWGATAMVIQVRDAQAGGEAPVPALLAEPGEANRVRIAPGPTDQTVLIEDLGAVLAAGSDCIAIDAHHARCENVDRERVLVVAGDRDDVVVASPGLAISARGGPGADRLTGADRSDDLSGGGGAGDVLAGMGADDVLGDGDGLAGTTFDGEVLFAATAVDADVLDGGAGNDTVSYAGREAAVHVDLSDTLPDGQAGEGDLLTSIEGAYGGSGPDRLTGSAEANVLEGGAGRDLIDAGAGADSVDGGGGADRIRSAAGADVVTGGKGDDRISLGSGDDVIYDKRQRGPTSRDRVSCGTGRDHIKAHDSHVGKLARDCELLTAGERLSGGPISATDAVSVRLRGVRRSGTSVLVALKCARAAGNPACVISGRLRTAGGKTTLARTLSPVKVKPGRQATLRLRLTPAGLRRVRRGEQVRLLVAERTAAKAGARLRQRARAQAQIVMS